MFKKYKYIQDKRGNWKEVEYDTLCPQCSNPMFNTGSAFKAPKSTDTKAWTKLRPLFENGYTFNSDLGNPFKTFLQNTNKKPELPESEFRKSVRKRNKG
ncbi:hypothetical protein [Aliikangiella sp. G2MR2-5]|uniref:hypothetical protein n=1 Tax=Aliikangiella sp. G2MR2-5 TaxID=2788943 RepID=UPI001AED3301|nr:hypothetical protein [Aliikangiella sp. G2MR2-5]